MKREIAVFLIITMVLSLSACGKTLKGTDGLIEKAREEIPISDSDTIDLQYAGMCGNDNRAIAWFISGNEYQKHYYLPMEVEVKEDAAEYTFIRTYKPIDDRIGDIAYIQWGDGYAFMRYFYEEIASELLCNMQPSLFYQYMLISTRICINKGNLITAPSHSNTAPRRC